MLMAGMHAKKRLHPFSCGCSLLFIAAFPFKLTGKAVCVYLFIIFTVVLVPSAKVVTFMFSPFTGAACSLPLAS